MSRLIIYQTENKSRKSSPHTFLLSFNLSQYWTFFGSISVSSGWKKTSPNLTSLKQQLRFLLLDFGENFLAFVHTFFEQGKMASNPFSLGLKRGSNAINWVQIQNSHTGANSSGLVSQKLQRTYKWSVTKRKGPIESFWESLLKRV